MTAGDRTVDGSWRTPRLSRGSVMFLRTRVRGCLNKAFVVENDISEGPGTRRLIKHHSSPALGPRPSDTPLHGTAIAIFTTVSHLTLRRTFIANQEVHH